MSIGIINHNGKVFRFDSESRHDAVVECTGDRYSPTHHGQVDYIWRLKDAHEGEPIEVWMLHVREDRDEDGFNPAWDRLVWADDETPCDEDWVLDFYTDALRDDLRIIISETWD